MNKYLELQDKLCQAMEVFVENAVNKAGFDRTIQGTVVSCVDESIGQYKIQYQDSVFYAYAQNDEKYSSGTGVYILIQNNDMARDKFIIGTVDKLGMDYLSIIDESNRYEKIGANCLNFSNEIQLCSYLKEDSYLIDINSGYIKNNDLLTYIENAECLLIQMDAQTALDQIQRRKGNYGLEVELVFKNELNENASYIIRKYIIDINQMTGNPYLYIDKTSQLFVISIDNENFLGIKSIKAFSKDFPKEENGMPKDIFFSNLAIYAASHLDDSKLTVPRLAINSPKGLVFSNNALQLNIEAIVRTGNEITKGMDYYWFVEDVNVTSNSDDFLIFGGQGWKCLNFYDTIEIEDEETREWKPDINSKIFNINDQLAEQVRYKCVAVKGTEILSKEFILYNSLAQYKIELVSDIGTTFYNGIGNPILTCKVIKDNAMDTDCKYVWSYIDKNNILTLMNHTNSEMTVSISSIDDFNIYKCSVYKDSLFIGSAEITLLNKKGTEGVYNLAINNGTRAYIYNEEGISPASNNVINPITILPLSFTLFDSNGQQFDEEILASLDFSWKVPAENTLLKVNGGELIDGYYYFRGAEYLQLNYKIESIYSIDKSNNQIELNLTYKDLRLKAITNFTFIKEGEIGTNGTGAILQIVANQCEELEEPMWYYNKFNNTYGKNYDSLKAILSSNEEVKIIDETSTESNCEWNILLNNYGNNIKDITNLSYTKGVGFQQSNYYPTATDDPANIIKFKITYNNKKYISTLPMITALIFEEGKNYIPFLKKNTGFRNVQYSADGMNPKCRNADLFEIGLKDLNGNLIDISNGYQLDWSLKGKVSGFIGGDVKNKNPNTFLITKENNLFKCFPVEKYDGRDTTLALECIIRKKEANNLITYARLHIPIYFYLNTYGYSALNDWDGNSIEIDDQGGHILTPQIGAGEKNASNQFTGLLMGKMVDSSKSEKIGLIGLYNGTQTIFLDSKTGGAYFGEAGAGQIRIIPGQDPVIEGGGYGKNNTKGLQINLSEDNPGIKFGNGNFSVDKTGKLEATGVDLTGKITANEGYIGTKESGFKINYKYIANGNITGVAVTNQSGVYIGTDGINISGGTPATTSYITKGSVNIGGKLTFGLNSNSQYELAVNGNVTTNLLKATGGTIGCWELDSNRMYDVAKTAGVNKAGQGMAFWAGSSSDKTGNNSAFYVQHDGKMHASNVDITGIINATSITAKKEYKIYIPLDVDDKSINQTFIQATQPNSNSSMLGFGIGMLEPKKDEYVTYFNPELPHLLFDYWADGGVIDSPGLTIEGGTGGLRLFSTINENEYGFTQRSGLHITDSYVQCYGERNIIMNIGNALADGANFNPCFMIAESGNKANPIIISKPIYSWTTDGGSNVRVSSDGSLKRYKSSSSRRYKHNIKNLNLNEIYGLYSVPVRTFIYNLDYLNKDSERYNKAIPGLIAEEIAAVNDLLVDHNEDGSVEMWNNNILVPCMLKLIQHNYEEINDLKQQVKQLQAKLDNI